MAQRILAEGQESDRDARRIVPGRVRHVRPYQVRRHAERREKIRHDGQMQHLLRGNANDHATPSFDGGELSVRDAFVHALLECESGEQVLAHEPVL